MNPEDQQANQFQPGGVNQAAPQQEALPPMPEVNPAVAPAPTEVPAPQGPAVQPVQSPIQQNTAQPKVAPPAQAFINQEPAVPQNMQVNPQPVQQVQQPVDEGKKSGILPMVIGVAVVLVITAVFFLFIMFG